MYERIKRLYIEKRLDNYGVAEAVRKGLITESQYESITGEPYENAPESAEEVSENG